MTSDTTAKQQQAPQPRSDWKGTLDRFIGPGATTAELTLQLVPPILFGLWAPRNASNVAKRDNWSNLQLFFVGLLALDMMGGILTNATSAAKRWYHRPGQGYKDHMAFLSVHVLHIVAVAYLFRDGDTQWAIKVVVYLFLAANAVLLCPLYLQRPVALLFYSFVLLCHQYFLVPTPGLEWFLPMFFLKLLISHLLYETPYSPNDSMT